MVGIKIENIPIDWSFILKAAFSPLESPYPFSSVFHSSGSGIF
jgi:hypothetical protein